MGQPFITQEWLGRVGGSNNRTDELIFTTHKYSKTKTTDYEYGSRKRKYPQKVLREVEGYTYLHEK